jgi:hypothetical protein
MFGVLIAINQRMFMGLIECLGVKLPNILFYFQPFPFFILLGIISLRKNKTLNK